MKPIRTSLILLLAAGLFPQAAAAQDLPKDLRSQVGELLNETARKEVSIGKILIDSISMEKNELIFFANMNCSYIPFRRKQRSRNLSERKSAAPPRVEQTEITDPDRPPCHRRTDPPGTSK